jgi:ABC-type bacteriocin/lantibiotic exporter with double-glycine peptidase domain
MSPLKRFYNLLELDKKDVYQLFFYAIFSGLISLSLPLGIQAIINFIQSGRVSASWVVLTLLVVLGVILVGVLSIMQLRITENLQQKIFIRSSFDFALRLPKIKFEALYNSYPPELANRFFDTLTIQKGTSKLLIDFSAAILQILFGIILLSLYHSYFIMFGIMLLLMLYFIFKLSYNPGLDTSLMESKYKYKVAAWLQELARNNISFRDSSNHSYALTKNDMLVSDYLKYREKHFDVIKSQFSRLILFKVIITAGLLSIGGYLVISQQMNIGQFVAAEIVILLVIGSVEKIILGLETLYDVLTSVEKIGLIADLELEEDAAAKQNTDIENFNLDLENLEYNYPESSQMALQDINLKIKQSEIVFIDGVNGSGKSTLIRLMSGLFNPSSGSFYVNDDSYNKLNINQYRTKISSVTHGETPFEGTILENITCNNPSISKEDMKWAVEGLELGSYIKNLPKGIETSIFQEGRQMSSSDAQKIVLARAIAKKPKILFLEDPTDTMDDEDANHIIDFITNPDNKWTIVVSSKNSYWKNKCSRSITMQKGKIISDKKN